MMITTVQPANASAADVSEAAETAAAVVEVTGAGDVVTSMAADADSAAIAETAVGTVDGPSNTGGETAVGMVRRRFRSGE